MKTREETIEILEEILGRKVETIDGVMQLQGVNFVVCRINRVEGSFIWADLTGIDLSQSNLRGSNFWSLNLEKANFVGADLRGGKLGRANLQGANFEGANIGMASFRDSNLEGANFEGANLGSANFEEADLNGANFKGCNFLWVELRGTILDGVKA